MNKKGFTLVEIIVVLVIIAILAAIALPALTGYISDARDKALLNDVRMVQIATQSAVAQKGASGNYNLYIERRFGKIVIMGSDERDINEMAERLLGDQMPEKDWAQVTITNGTATETVYNSYKSKRSMTLKDGTYTIGEYDPIRPEK